VSMSPAISTAFPRPIVTSSSKVAIRAGRVLSGIAVAFLTLDAAMKLLQVQAAVEGTIQLGYPASSLVVIGLIQVVCLAVYLVPRTAILGAVLWTGYLGGAIATHVRVGNPLFTHILFPIYVAALLWGSLWLRDRRLRGVFSPLND
jgi:DoxX-like family